MEMLYMIWLMLYTMKFISAYERTYQPYGPRMCKALEARYGSVKYHSNNFTCYVSGEKTNKSCEELIYNRKGQAVCIQATTPEPRSPRLFIKVEGISLLIVDILSGREVKTIGHPSSEPFMSCSKDEQKIYFQSKKKESFSLDPYSQKVETFTKRHTGQRILGLAVDGTTQILYAFTKSRILKQKIGQDSDFGRFQTLASPRGIVTVPKRGQLFAHNNKGIYSYNASTGKRKGTYLYTETIDLVYDSNSDWLYSVKERTLLRLSCDLRKLSELMSFGIKILNLCVYQGIAFIHSKSPILFAMNMTSPKQIWARQRRHLKDMCVQ